MSARREELTRLHAEALERAGSHWNTSVLQGSRDLEQAYRDLARVSFLEDGDIDGFLHGMYLAAATRRRLLACVARGMACPEATLRSTDLSAIFAALASGDRAIAAELAGSPLPLQPGPDDPRMEIAFAEALRLAAQGRLAEAQAPLSRFDRAREGKAEDRALILGGVLRIDGARFQRGMARLLEAIRPPPGEARLSIEALGFARLGQRVGLSIATRDAAIPDELLGDPEAPYPDAAAILPPIPAEILDVRGKAFP